MTKRLPSLDLLSIVVGGQLEAQLRHFDGLDNKAGIVLGFAGLLVALSSNEGFLSTSSRLSAVLSALLALWSFLPRGFPVLDLRGLRDRYLRSDLEFAQLHILDTRIRMEEQASNLLDRKASRLKSAIVFLGLAVFLGAGSILAGGGS